MSLFKINLVIITLHAAAADSVTNGSDLGEVFCEAQGKGRAKGRHRKVTQRSFIDGGCWMVDIYLFIG